MNRVRSDLFAILGSLAICACGAPAERTEVDGELAVGKTSAALEGEQTTTSPVVFVCSASTAFYLLFEVTQPASVEPSEAFPVTVHIANLIPPTVAPFSGTFASKQELLATQATPSSQSLDMGSFHFATGQTLGDIGSATTTLTAAARAGGPIVLNAGAFDYTITQDPVEDPLIVAHCVPPSDQPSTLATIPVVRPAATKDDCKDDEWQTHTDATGNAFKNQGQCVKYVVH